MFFHLLGLLSNFLPYVLLMPPSLIRKTLQLPPSEYLWYEGKYMCLRIVSLLILLLFLTRSVAILDFFLQFWLTHTLLDGEYF